MKRIVLSLLFLATTAMPALADHDDSSGNEFGGCVGDSSSSSDAGDGCVSGGGNEDSCAGGGASTFGLFALAAVVATRRRVA